MHWQQMLPTRLEDQEEFCQLTLVPDRPNPIVHQATSSPSGDFGNTPLENTAMVSQVVRNDNRLLEGDQRQTGDNDPRHGIPPQLVIWNVSGNVTRVRAFLKQLLHSCSVHGGRKPINLTTHSLGSGVASVLNGIQIPLQDLHNRCGKLLGRPVQRRLPV